MLGTLRARDEIKGLDLLSFWGGTSGVGPLEESKSADVIVLFLR